MRRKEDRDHGTLKPGFQSRRQRINVVAARLILLGGSATFAPQNGSGCTTRSARAASGQRRDEAPRDRRYSAESDSRLPMLASTRGQAPDTEPHTHHHITSRISTFDFQTVVIVFPFYHISKPYSITYKMERFRNLLGGGGMGLGGAAHGTVRSSLSSYAQCRRED